MSEYLCPNCLTPWKCNGPHLDEGATAVDALRWLAEDWRQRRPNGQTPLTLWPSQLDVMADELSPA